MAPGRRKGTTAKIQRGGLSGQDPRYLYMPTDAPLTIFKKHVEIEAVEKANTHIRVTMGAQQERDKGVEYVERSGTMGCI